MFTRKFRIVFFACLLIATGLQAQRQMEYLSRGLVVQKAAQTGNFLSWRILATDPDDIGFNIYKYKTDADAKTAIKLNTKPITGKSSYMDITGDSTIAYSYKVVTVIGKKETKDVATYNLSPNTKPYWSIPLKTPQGYTPNDASVGDLDGDGNYEIILHQVGRAKDNSQAGITDPPIFQAYKMDGTLLWTINLGKNIRDGAHYTQFMVYDLDGDGRAEIAMKTADGSVDGKGNVIGDSSKDYRNERGYILSGPEFLTVFNGLTGELIHTVPYWAPRHPTSLNPTTEELKELWGDGYGNRMDRFLACVAYLDGVKPSLVMCRGYYTRTTLGAWDLVNGKLVERWKFDSHDASKPGNRKYAGQGNHNLTVADVDGDGKDEIVYGAMVVDDNGEGLYSTGLGHGDALHVSDLDPTRPGLEVFDIQERFDDAGIHFRDAKTGEILWKKPSIKAGADGEGPGRGLSLDVDPRYPGHEQWAAGAGITGMYDAKGNKISDKNPSVNMGIFWDGDLLREVLNGTRIDKWDYVNSKADRLFSAADFNCAHNNGTKANPTLSADLFGDWREELICRTTDNLELRIFSTNIPTDYGFTTFMHDPQYRLSIAWQNVAYNQPPHTSFFVGHDMKKPPRPSLKMVKYNRK